MHSAAETPDNVETGVYYDPSAYAGLGRRLLILLTDMIGFILLMALMLFPFMYLPESDVTAHAITISLIVLSLLYFAILKRTSIGTLGYIITGVRIVDLTGNKPSIGRMLFRTLFIVIGPLNLFLDLFWVGNDREKQSLRDKLAGTYVIRKKASILGRGKITFSTYTFFGYSFIFKEVSHDVT